LEAPVGGWDHYLSECGVEIINDDLGRRSVRRADAARLLREQTAARQRARELAQRNEQQAIEADRQWRAALPKGVAWYEVPPGVLPVVAMTQAAKDAEPKRTSVLEDSLSGSGTVMHILPPTPMFEDE
jgi:hypothetical protein